MTRVLKYCGVVFLNLCVHHVSMSHTCTPASDPEVAILAGILSLRWSVTSELYSLKSRYVSTVTYLRYLKSSIKLCTRYIYM